MQCNWGEWGALQHPMEKSTYWAVTHAGHLPALPELRKGLAGYSGTCEMMLTKLRALKGHSFSAQSHHHSSLGFFLFSLVLQSCCIHCNFYSLGNHPSSFPHVSCEAIHHSSPPQPRPLATDVGRCAKLKQYHISLNRAIGPAGHLTCHAKLFSGLYTHMWRRNLPSTDSPS